MNFDNIKDLMNKDAQGKFDVPTNVKLLKKSTLPIQQIRKSMKSEIATQLIFIVIFFAVLFVAELNPLPFSIYLIFMTLTSMMTLMYLIKMIFFVRESGSMTLNTKDAINKFIFELKLTLEVYVTAIVAGSLLLPIPMFALFFGKKTADGLDTFSKWFHLDISNMQIGCFVIGYLIVSALFYYITVKWADALYGRHIKNLEGILDEMVVE